MSLSEQAISFMVAAAAAYGPRALIPRAETGPETPETLGGSLLRMLPATRYRSRASWPARPIRRGGPNSRTGCTTRSTSTPDCAPR